MLFRSGVATLAKSLLKNSEKCNPKRQRGSETPRIQSSHSLADASGYILQQTLGERGYVQRVQLAASVSRHWFHGIRANIIPIAQVSVIPAKVSPAPTKAARPIQYGSTK